MPTFDFFKKHKAKLDVTEELIEGLRLAGINFGNLNPAIRDALLALSLDSGADSALEQFASTCEMGQAFGKNDDERAQCVLHVHRNRNDEWK